MTTKVKIAILQNWEMKAFWSLVFLLLGLIFIYLYLINISILSVVERQKNEEKISSQETELTLLVADYFSALATVDKEATLQLGFKPIEKEVIFVARTETGESLALSSLDNEIR
ncbi:MAG TPA: hypothetical protein ENN27_05545 [Candidatus Atribacteria bacterium]|nr:hypothetical protein [Candidatus Atribacteria bacterium]